MEPKGSLPHLQVPTICPYPEPYQSSPRPPIPLPEDPIKIYVFYLFDEGAVLKCEILNLWLLELCKIL
jgi:hypothetical protein